ncbi:MAG: LysE family translocator, partial [Gemmatimonadaceae bacterium]
LHPRQVAHACELVVRRVNAAGLLLNPKVALFFLAFLPQFVRRQRGAFLAQFVALGLIFAILGFIGDSTLATIVGRAPARLLGSSRFAALRERATGIVLISLGLRLALPDRR